jgi:hypothetical protein
LRRSTSKCSLAERPTQKLMCWLEFSRYQNGMTFPQPQISQVCSNLK